MTDQNYTHISFLLDRSGSMSSIRKEVIDGFNGFIDDQKAVPGTATISLMQFDTEFDYLRRMESLSTVEHVGHRDFIPRGATALRDAICKLIDETGVDLLALPEDKRPGKVLFVIFTDGLENSSQDYSVQDVNDRITRQRKDYLWQFVFLGANQDAIATGHEYGIPMAASMTISVNAVGAAAGSLSHATRRYRGASGQSLSFTAEDRHTQDEAEQ